MRTIIIMGFLAFFISCSSSGEQTTDETPVNDTSAAENETLHDSTTTDTSSSENEADGANEGAAPDGGNDTEQAEQIPSGDDSPVQDNPMPDNDSISSGFCGSFRQCGEYEVCNYALGRCERRDCIFFDPLAVYSFAPLAGTEGDLMVVDGTRFYKSLAGSMSVKAKIGNAQRAVSSDENRLLVELSSNDSGTVTVIGEGGAAATAAGTFTQAVKGILSCDSTTPAATGFPGTAADSIGPNGAGYVDINTLGRARIHYPADCGGLRRPAKAGTYPIVFILHGDGALYLNYEYLAQHLASWGFITAMPESSEENDINGIIDSFKGTSLSSFHAVLKDLKTTDKIAFVGHSRGTARTQLAVKGRESYTMGCVFLGPVDDGIKVPGSFMVLGATGDKQSTASFYNDAYSRQNTPKWKIVIKGGNHSLFSDHKVWLGALNDDAPTISRKVQFATVTSFVLPFMERIFGLTEHFPTQLDNPPSSAVYTVTHE